MEQNRRNSRVVVSRGKRTSLRIIILASYVNILSHIIIIININKRLNEQMVTHLPFLRFLFYSATRTAESLSDIYDLFFIKGQDTKMRFSVEPPINSLSHSTSLSTPCSSSSSSSQHSAHHISDTSGFQQWHDAMRMVARLPGGVPPEFRRKVS